METGPHVATLNSDTFSAEGHDNLDVQRVCPEGKVREAIQADGTLVTEVTLHFVVSHAAREPVTEATLIELIKDQIEAGGICPTNVSNWLILEGLNA